MKKLFALPLAAVVALGACSDTPTAFAPDELNIGVSSPGTAVSAEAQITGPEQTIVTFRSTPRGGAGSCNSTNGAWTQPNNNVHQNVPHNQCTDVTTVPGSTIEIVFATVANYVQPPSGNVHLNFSMCGYTEQEVEPDVFEWVESPCTVPTYIHYKHNKKTNSGVLEAAGVLYGQDDEDGAWTIDLGQLDGNPGPSGLAAALKEFVGLVANGPGGPAYAELSW